MNSKKCDLCGNKLTFYKLRFIDGAICSSCIVKYKFGTKFKIRSTQLIEWCKNHSISEVKTLISEGKDATDINTDQYSLKNQFAEIDKKKQTENLNRISLNDSLAEKEVTKIKSWNLDSKLNQQLINAKVIDLFAVKKELKYLPQLVDLNKEPLIYACSGILNGRTWLIVCTNQRVIFLNKNMIYGMQQEVIPLKAINAVTFTQKLMLGSISITNGANVTTIENVDKLAAPIMAQKIQDAKNALSNPAQNTASNNDLDDLRKLKALLDDGIITQEDFDAKKKQILGI